MNKTTVRAIFITCRRQCDAVARNSHGGLPTIIPQWEADNGCALQFRSMAT
jgi:hypothetical protein